jgi:CHAT domain-containing protein
VNRGVSLGPNTFLSPVCSVRSARSLRGSSAAVLLCLVLCPLSKPQQAAPSSQKTPDPIAEAREGLRAAEAEHPGNTPEVVGALLLLVQRECVGRKTSAETMEMAQRAVAASEAISGKESILYADALAEQAKVYAAEDQAEKGRPLVEQALEIAQRVAPGTQKMAEVADALDKVCWELNDLPCSLHAAEIAVSAIRTAHVENELYLASMLQDLAQIRLKLGDHQGARTAVLESIDIVNRQTKPSTPMPILESNAGAFFVREKQPEEALPHLKKSLALSTDIYGADSIQVGYATINLAELYARAGRFGEASAEYEAGLALFRRWYGATHTRTAGVERVYAAELAASGNPAKALDLDLNSHRARRETFALAVRVLPERQALTLAADLASGLDDGLSLIVGHPELDVDPVYQEVIRSRALVADEMAKRQASLNRNKDPQIAALLAELDKERAAALGTTGIAQSATGTQQSYSDAISHMERIERQLAKRSLQFREDQRTRAVELADLRRHVPAHAVLVSYVQYLRRSFEPGKMESHTVRSYLAFAVHPGSDRIRIFDLGEAAPIDALVQRARASADSEAHSGGLGTIRNERAWRQAALALRRRVWDPLQPEVGSAKLVLLVPDGDLNLIPFAGLPYGKGYLVERGPVIHILTSERDLIPADTSTRKAGLLAVGSPQFDLAFENGPASPMRDEQPAAPLPDDQPRSPLRDAAVACDQLRSLQFRPLPGSAREVSDIDSAWRRWNRGEASSLVTGAEATRDRFLVEAERNRVLHVATHAFVLDKSCGNGNPLLHSGLVFAGANQNHEAAILTAQQIASLDLSGVDWAVLSACNTGNGVLQDGEGVLGLERAFRVAGAHSIVMALWPVDDNATRRFMRELYAERLGRHASTADAVWNSSRALLLERRAAGKSTHPWYWAGIVGSGVWE